MTIYKYYPILTYIEKAMAIEKNRAVSLNRDTALITIYYNINEYGTDYVSD